MATKRLCTLKAGEVAEPIEVCVLNKWVPHNKQTELCFLLVDITGNAIEAICDASDKDYFETLIELQSCYIIDNYLLIPSRTYMAVVPNTTSLRLGKRATFKHVINGTIPHCYYNFATYTTLQTRVRKHVILSDYIGRVESIKTFYNTKLQKSITRVTIQDEWQNILNITFWNTPSFDVSSNTSIGKVLAITSTMVTEYEGSIQLESTNATTCLIDPPLDDFNTYISRFKDIKPRDSGRRSNPRISIEELIAKDPKEKTQARFECEAKIIDIFTNRKWYYALCSQCSKRLYPEKDGLSCVDDGRILNPKYMYCINTTITDGSATTKAVFFNDAMTSALQVPCEELVVKQGYSDPTTIPPQLLALIGVPNLLNVNLKYDGTIVVNHVSPINTSLPNNDEADISMPMTSNQRQKRKINPSEASSSNTKTDPANKRKNKAYNKD